MKFLADLNAGGPVTRWLRDCGHDLIEVADRDIRMEDDAILKWAVREDRIIVTTDPDFEELIYRQGREHRVLAASSCLSASCSAALEQRHIVIASESKIRIRRRG